MQPLPESLKNPLAGIAAGALAVTVVTGALVVLDNFIPVLSLGVLYVFAVLPIALVWGAAYAVPVAVASMLAFNFFFLPPLYTFTLADRSNWFALLVYVVTAVVVGSLASRARGQRAEAEQRELESSLLADIAAELLRGTHLEDELERIEQRTATVLGVSSVRIVLGGRVSERTGEAPHALAVYGREIGTIYTPGERGACARDPAAIPAGACLAAGRHPGAGAALQRCVRGRGASPQRHDQDGSHPGRVARSPDAARHDRAGARRAPERRAVAFRPGPSRAAGDDSLRACAAEAASRKPPRSLAAPGWCGRSAAPSSGRRTSCSHRRVDELVDSERVVVSTRPDLPPVQVDATQIQRALVNVLENAIRLSPPGEPVHVRVNATRKELLIRVTDRGPGDPGRGVRAHLRALLPGARSARPTWRRAGLGNCPWLHRGERRPPLARVA